MMSTEENLLKELGDQKVLSIELIGESGSGKTWLVKRVNNLAIKEGLFDFVLWVYFSREYRDPDALSRSFATQLSLISTSRERKNDTNKPLNQKNTNEPNTLWYKIKKELDQKRLLLVLDDVENERDVMGMIDELKRELVSVQEEDKFALKHYKFLITKKPEFNLGFVSDFERSRRIEMNLLSKDDAMSLFEQREVLDQSDEYKKLVKTFIDKRKKDHLPCEIVLLSRAINYFMKLDKKDDGLKKFKQILNEISNNNQTLNLLHLLRNGYEELPSNVLLDLCSEHNKFFIKRRMIHYNMLISYWMMEGYLDCQLKSYEDGYELMMALIDCRILKIVDVDYVVIQQWELELNLFEEILFGGEFMYVNDWPPNAVRSTACLGLADIEVDRKWDYLGYMDKGDGMMRSISKAQEQEEGSNITSLLLDGNLYTKQVQGNVNIQFLAIFNPVLLPCFVSQMDNLSLLILRGNDFLNKIDDSLFLKLRNMRFLEISGPSMLEDLPDQLFEPMTQLQSLNLSGLRFTSLPSSFYSCLKQLKRLILRDCSRFQKLEKIGKLSQLEMLDLSGAISFDRFGFSIFTNKNLEMMNFSRTKIENLPITKKLTELTHLILRYCPELNKLPNVFGLEKLQVFDVSNSMKLEKTVGTHGVVFLNSLKVLDLSGCHSLKRDSLKAISLDRMIQLRILDISETDMLLPTVSDLTNLKKLRLRNCKNLEEVYGLESLTKLEVLDLSYSNIRQLPSLENLKMLSQLLLTGCTRLEEFRKKEISRIFEVTDKDLPYGISNLVHLQHLLLP